MAARLRTLPAAVAPVLVGTALSATERHLRIGGFVAGQLTQVFNIFFKPFDFLLAIAGRGLGFILVFIFVFGGQALTISTARSPQICRTASTS